MFSKPFSPRTLFSLASTSPYSPPFPYSILIAHFSTSSHSHLTYSHSQSSAESRNVRVSVWWDFENCHVPSGVNVFRVAHAITAAVRSSGIKGPIQITAFGDMMQLSRINQEALSSTGINLTHIPSGGKNSADRSLLLDLMYWVSQNPPPAHLFLITGDRDFASILHRLRMSNYNILLASTDTAPSVLCSAASIMWNWNTLARGENLTGRHFNQPPDGPFGSWYGHYKGALDDPFPATEQPICARVEELPETTLEPSARPIPKDVVKLISHILTSNPKGISIGELRHELAKSNVGIDKDFYGYRKFSRFLLSMPHILKLKAIGDGQYIVRSSAGKAPEPFDRQSVSVTNREDVAIAGSTSGGSSLPSVPPLDVKQTNLPQPPGSEKAVDNLLKKLAKPPTSEKEVKMQTEQPLRKLDQLPGSEKEVKMHTEQPLTKLEQPPSSEKDVKMHKEQPPNSIGQPPLVGEKVVEVVNALATENQMPPIMEQKSIAEVGFFEKLRKIWYGNDYSEIKSNAVLKESNSCENTVEEEGENTPVKCEFSGDTLQLKEVEKKCMKSLNHNDDPPFEKPCPESTVKSSAENAATMCSDEPCGENAVKSPGLFKRIMSRFKFWRSNSDSVGSDDQPSEALQQSEDTSGKHEVFSDKSFWRAMEAFINTDKGSSIITQSRTRLSMAQSLQNEGPSVLQSVAESDVLRLVEILISEKKWVQECPSDAAPFKLVPSVGNKPLSDSCASTGLRSIFLAKSDTENKVSSSNSVSSHGENKIQSSNGCSESGSSDPATNSQPSEKSRTEILGDCQKLANELLKEFPKGCSLTSFRKLFVERYGYNLDVKKLGYQKLASLLQIMPGVKVESHYLIPSKATKQANKDTTATNVPEGNTSGMSASSDSELSDASKRDDESDSPWEELGPVDDSGSQQKEPHSALSGEPLQETKKRTCPDYESPFSDDEFSDSEGEQSPLTKPEGRTITKTERSNEDSSLLQILDSWYNTSDGDNTKRKPNPSECNVDCSENGLLLSDSNRLVTKIENSSGTNTRRPRPQRTYSFVESSGPAGPGDKKRQVIDGIIGSLKRSTESSIQN